MLLCVKVKCSVTSVSVTITHCFPWTYQLHKHRKAFDLQLKIEKPCMWWDSTSVKATPSYIFILRTFWDLSKWGRQHKNNNISEQLAGNEAPLRPSCSPVTHQEVLRTESLQTEWHWTTKEGDERDTLGNTAGIIHKFWNIIFVSIFQDSNAAGP